MSELKTLPSSLREKRRYLVFEIVEGDGSFGEIVNAIWDAMLTLNGTDGTAAADMWAMRDRYDPETQRGLIRVRKDALAPTRAALILIEEIGGTAASLRVIGVTGTVDSAEKRYLL